MVDTDYLTSRLDNQIKYYDDKAIDYKKYHDNINIASIILSTSGSFLTLLGIIFNYIEPWLTIIGALTGIIVASALSIDKLKKFGELFVIYRRTCESLKREKYLYNTSSGEYQSNDDAFNLLVERCESIMATENGTWVQLNEKKKD